MAYKNIKNIIVGTACNLFREKGYDNISVNEICSACSITKPTFYYHFKAKEDILFSQYHNLLSGFDSLLSDLPDASNGLEQFLTAFNCIFDIIINCGYDFIQNLLIASMKDIEKNIVLPDSFKKYILQSIKKGQKDGSITNLSSPDDLYLSCYHTLFGYVIFWCQHNGLITEFHSLENVLSVILTSKINPENEKGDVRDISNI